jgi:hypothetical protein
MNAHDDDIRSLVQLQEIPDFLAIVTDRIG